ncbi:MAG: ATP-dependent Clp protease ATP-binding subunit, partial [Clostridia bacterium]|nr:ATP-dependent Clp protease ATP-binding subunit [Clostridia bacterium]
MPNKAHYTKLCSMAKLFADKVRKESVKSKISTYHFVFSSLYIYKNFVEKTLDNKILKDDELNDCIVDFTSIINKYKVSLDKALGWMYTRMNDEKENSISLFLGYNKAIFELEKNFKETGEIITLNSLFDKVINDQNSLLAHILSNRFGGFNIIKDIKEISKKDDEVYKKLLLSCYDQVSQIDAQTDDETEDETAQTATAQDISSLFNAQTQTAKSKTSQSTDAVYSAISSATRGTDKKSTAKVNENFLSKLVKQTKEMQKLLRKEIFGQDYAIKSFITGYFRSEIFAQIHKNRNKPRATFLFAGAPGVGKTFLAESVAKILGLPYKRFDMSEYADKEANIEFCGSDKVYKNGKAGNVTEFVEKNPKCVLLFDEVEKCHQVVTYLFLQMLDAGRLRDNYTDNEVSFTDAIIIFTTNAGKQLYENNDITTLSEVSRKVVLQALSEDINPVTQVPLFPKAICSRFASGNVVVFNNLNTMDLIKIVKGELNKNAIAYGRQFKTDI